MASLASPLRYPGGKSCLLDLTVDILSANQLTRGHYAEPYAGGCGLALSLLYGGYVSEIHVNDIDRSIWSFWKAVLDHTDDFLHLIETTPVTVDEWHRQRDVQKSGTTENPIELGFSTFFLNRTSRSGIIQSSGVIGGLDQSGKYKIDCRFNRDGLKKRVRRVSRYRSRIHLSNLDAIDFMGQAESLPQDTFFCIDPPYFNKGSSLYTSFYRPSDHADVAVAVARLKRPWIVTYDLATEIQLLYSNYRQFEFDINYSVHTKRVGTELLVASKNLRLPAAIRDRRTTPPKARAA